MLLSLDQLSVEFAIDDISKHLETARNIFAILGRDMRFMHLLGRLCSGQGVEVVERK